MKCLMRDSAIHVRPTRTDIPPLKHNNATPPHSGKGGILYSIKRKPMHYFSSNIRIIRHIFLNFAPDFKGFTNNLRKERET